MKNIVFIVGSLRKQSFNRQLAALAEKMLSDQFNIKYLEFEDIPLMNQDLEASVPAPVARVRKEILAADGIWIFTPEYNFSYPGLLKNLLDWLSRPMDMSNFNNPSAVVGKKVTASGAGGANKTASCRAKLNELLEFIKMQVMTESQTGIALGVEAWTKGEFNLTDEQIAQLKTQAEKFSAFVNA
ncbi:MAG: NAD(P)H-dependent oxidoreductase [Bacteroidales bacterium]|nr:NAD(P)H-dependent oxidoreductase [Bacteroidales bacterium]